jgi:hypothetical protein
MAGGDMEDDQLFGMKRWLLERTLRNSSAM